MYHSYFGIEEQAFSIAVNPRYLYMSAQHREALAHLLYGVNSGGFVMLTGEVGTGKTTTIRCLLEQLPDNADIAMVLNPAASARDLLCSICDEIGVHYKEDETSLKVLTDKLHERLIENHREGRRTIVLIDEAQLLRVSTLEQIRLLTNLESNTQKLLQIILVGQPELNELLAKPALRQLSQRITARYHLRPLSLEETTAYIKHRLTVAGMPAGRHPFPPRVIKKVYTISQGIPRLINVLCDRMLLGAYSQEVAEVDTQICRKALAEVMGTPEQKDLASPTSAFKKRLYAYGSAALVASFLIGVIFQFSGTGNSPLSGSVNSLAGLDSSEHLVDGEGVSGAVLAVTESGTTEQQLPTRPNPKDRYWVLNKDQALESLLYAIGISNDTAIYPCWLASQKGYHCEQLKVDTWEEFKEINRPAVLTLTTPSRRVGYVTLVGFNGDQALVMHKNSIKAVGVDQLGVLWTGEFDFIWYRPEMFDVLPIGMGSVGPAVEWIAVQFAKLDGQPNPLAKEGFNTALEKRVKKFQASQNLKDDGFVGMQTLLRLNEALEIDASLDTLTFSDQQPVLSVTNEG